jgi:hypothetical protein
MSVEHIAQSAKVLIANSDTSALITLGQLIKTCASCNKLSALDDLKVLLSVLVYRNAAKFLSTQIVNTHAFFFFQLAVSTARVARESDFWNQDCNF